MHEDTRPNGNTVRRTDDKCKQHETTESTSSRGVETGLLLQATHGEDTCTGKNEKDTKMSLIPRSRSQTKEISYATGDHPMGLHNDVMQTTKCKTKRLLADEYQKDFQENIEPVLQKPQETLSYVGVKSGPDRKDSGHDVSQGEQGQVSRSTHVIHLKKYMNYKKKTLECTDNKYNSREKKLHQDREGANTVVYDDEQSSCPNHVPILVAGNLSHKYVCTDRGANAESNRNSYERLNMDTMEPRDKVCQCKAHPGRARSRQYRTMWGGQPKTSPDTCSQTSPMPPYIEALCQRTAEIILQKLSSKPETNETVQIAKIDRQLGGKGVLDTIVDGFVRPDENNNLSNVATGGFDEGDFQSNKEMNPFGRDSISHESGCHMPQHFDFHETSFCNIPIHSQSDVKQDAELNDEEVEGIFCE